jgi:hypothetical protein
VTPRKTPPLPTSIDVGPLTYAITDDVLSHKLAEHESKSALYGKCDHMALVISLNPDQAPGQARGTLLHESLHAVIAVSGVKIGSDEEEALVSAIEMPLLALLRDNPVWVAFLTGGTA